jgi:cytidyltransferase-like protein
MSWSKINHGGSPTQNKDFKRAVFIGRYQPYHFGHIYLINQKLSNGIPVLIMIRDIEPDEKNPLTAEEAKRIIEKYHNTRNEDVKVIVIPDIESVNYGRGVGYEVNEYIPNEEIANISATYIRNSISNNDTEWEKYVPKSIREDIINYIQ